MELTAKKDSLFDVIAGIILYIYLGVTLLIVLASLFGGGGIESEQNKTVFVYAEIIGLIGITLIFMLKFGQWLIQITNNYKKLGWLGSVIHDPEQSKLPNSWIKSWIKNPLILAAITIIPCSILGVIQVYQNTFFKYIPQRVSQQIQESSQALLSIFPSDLEVMLPFAFAGLGLAINEWALNTKRISKSGYYAIRFGVIPIVYVLTWLLYHLWRYQNDSNSIGYEIIFGTISAYMLVTFMSIVPPLVFKLLNNLYQYLNGAISTNDIVLMISIALNVLVLGSLFLYFTTRKKAKVET